MALQPRTPFKVFLRVQESPDEDLSVDAAFAKQPDAVRDALLEAIRLVPLRSTDITLLRIENTFLSALKRPWKEPHGLRLVLESCRQGKIENRTERLFLKHGKEYGIVVLGVGTKQDDHRLFRDIDPLPEEDLIRLIENVQRFPKKASITAFLEEFAQSPLDVVSDLPHQFGRPRSRRKGDAEKTALAEGSRPLTSPAVNPDGSKGRKSRSRRQDETDNNTLPLNLRSSSPLPPDPGLRDASQRNKRRRLDPVPNNFEPFEAVDSLLTPSYHSEHTTPADPLPQLPSNYVQNTFPPTSEPRDIQDQPGLGQERWSQEPQWEFSEEQFIQSRLGIYDPPSSQAQEPRWEFAEEPFIQSRLSIYDPRGSQAQEPQWEFAEEPFIQSRLDVNDMQSAQKSISFGG